MYQFCILVLDIVGIAGTWMVLKKAGKEGWWSLIPFANLWKVYEVAGVNPATSLLAIPAFLFGYLSLVPILMGSGEGTAFLLVLALFSFLFYVIYFFKAMISLADKFGQSGGFAAGLILVHSIFMAILGFGNYTYNGVKDTEFKEKAEEKAKETEKTEEKPEEKTEKESNAEEKETEKEEETEKEKEKENTKEKEETK